MNPSSTASEVPKFSYAFQVYTFSNRIFHPLATLIEQPTTDASWVKPNCLSIAECSRRMIQFLSNKDPGVRCKLRTEVEWAMDQNIQYPTWCRVPTERIENGPNTATEEKRQMSMQNPDSIRYPYITLGIKNCIEAQHVPGVQHNWTQASLNTFFEMHSKYIIVAFDITDLDNVSYTVLKKRYGQPETMRAHCGSQFRDSTPEVREGIEGSPAIAFLDKVPGIERSIMQVFLETPNLKTHEKGATNEYMKHLLGGDTWSTPTLVHHGKLLDTILSDGSKVVQYSSLTCNNLEQMIHDRPTIVWLGFSSKILDGASDADRHDLIDVLGTLPSLVAVYVTDPLQSPYMPETQKRKELDKSARLQAFFFDIVGRRNKELLKKVSGSSLFSWRLSPMLHNCLIGTYDANILKARADAEILKERADAEILKERADACVHVIGSVGFT